MCMRYHNVHIDFSPCFYSLESDTTSTICLISDFRVGGDGEEEGEGPVSNGSIDPQASRRAELARLKQRVAELESQLGMRKKRGLKFTVSNMNIYVNVHWIL